MTIKSAGTYMQISDLCKSCSKQNFCGNGMTDYYCSGYAPIVATEWKMLTNEEWLHTLNTEEMVDYLYSVHKGGASVERQFWIENHKERIKMQFRGWLKEKRTK